MSQALVYVDCSEVREGALEQLKDAIRTLADFIEENEPQLISYTAFFSEDGRHMTVIHVHADSASLDYHMDVAGPPRKVRRPAHAVIDSYLRGGERQGAWTVA